MDVDGFVGVVLPRAGIVPLAAERGLVGVPGEGDRPGDNEERLENPEKLD